MDRDMYPSGQDARVAWHKNLAKHIPDFKSKYSIPQLIIDQLIADSAWLEFWVDYRHAFDSSSQQLTKFFNTIAGKDDSAEAPTTFTIEGPDTPPTDVPPGIEKRARDIASFVKGNKAVYAVADGELLGFEAAVTDAPDISELTAEFTLTTQAEFKLKAEFKKRGMDGIRFEYRHIGGTWAPAGVLLTSGGRFTVPPSESNKGEQVEIRGIYIKGNEDVGIFSGAIPAFIAP